jgi:hypothetical protein
MDANKIESFLYRLGCEKIKRRGEWVRATCPLARWTHSGGKDKHPSFGISIDGDGESHCKCLACSASGSLYALLWNLDERGFSYPELFDFLRKHNQRDLDREAPVSEDNLRERLKRVDKYEAVNAERPPRFVEQEEKQASIPEDVLLQYRQMPEEIRQWLMGPRGLTEETIRAWELGWHPDQKRVVIPIRDETKTLVALSGRTLTSTGGPKYLHSRFKRDRVLYGSHRLTPVPPLRRGYLCEGFFHVMALDQFGYKNAVARMGTHLSTEQAEKLVTWFSELVIIPDGDLAGRNSAMQIAELLKMKMPVRVVTMPDGQDIDSLPEFAVRELLGTPPTL